MNISKATMRTTGGVAAFLTFVVLFFATVPSARGDEQPKPSEPEAAAAQPAEGLPARQLRPLRIDVVAHEEPLDKLLRRVAARNGSRIWFDERAIQSANLRLDEPVTVMLRNFTVEAAFARILRGRPLYHWSEDDVLIITTAPPFEMVRVKPRMGMLTMEAVKDENGVIQRSVADTTFDMWLYGNSLGPAETRARFARILQRKLDSLSGRCGLTEPQKQRLQLAGRGDISRFFERVERLRVEFSEVKNDLARRNAFFEQQVLPLEAVLNGGPFDDNSLFSKTVSTSLTAEQTARQAPRALPAYGVVEKIGLALQGYYDSFGSFPPSVMTGPDGKTKYSWRVELLPMLAYYVDGQPGGEVLWSGQLQPEELRRAYWKLIERLGYRLDEPWDGPGNRDIQKQLAAYYRHPTDPAGSVNSAVYVVTGPETAFPAARGAHLADILDGPGSTLLAVEARRDVPWAKPQDIPFDAGQALPPLGFDKGMFLALTCDGAVHSLAASTPESALRALVTSHAQDVPSIPGVPWKGPAPLASVIDVDKTGTLSAVITFDGPVPPANLLKLPAAAVAPNIPDESLIVDAKTGGIANVVVYLEKAPAGVAVPAAPPEPVAVKVAGGRFVPHVFVVRTGQAATFTNNDPVAVNVHTNQLRNSGTNRVLKPQGTFDLICPMPEKMPFAIRSDVQPWMKAYELVVDHPWAAVSDANGALVVKDLPAGIYQFVVWHESAGYLERKLQVVIRAGETTEAELSYPAERFGK